MAFFIYQRKTLQSDNFHTFDVLIDDDSADATFSSNVDCLEVTFTSNNTGDTHSWDFGDGSPLSSDPNPPPHTYMSPGTYTVSHTVTDACGTTTETQTITVSSCFSCNCPYATAVGTPGEEVLFSDLEDAGILQNGTVVNFCVAGTLVFDEAVVFFAGSNIAMDEGAELRVENNNMPGTPDLWLNNTNVFGVCNRMWRSITAEAGSTILFQNGTTISDAQYGINATTNANLNILNSTFDNNYTGIHGADGQFNMTIVGSTFDCTTGLLPAFDGQSPAPGNCGYAGIHLSTDGYYTIGNTATAANQFQNIGNGIITSGCGMTLRNSNFSNIQRTASEPYPFTGYGVHATAGNASRGQILDQIGNGEDGAASFSNCHTGIFASGMIVNRINENNMGGMQLGVSIEHAPFTRVNYNTIGATSRGVQVYQAHAGSIVQVDHNTISISGNLKGKGIEINQTGLASGDFRVEWNSITIDGQFTKGIHLIANGGTRVTDNDVLLSGAVNRSAGIEMAGNPNGFVSCNTVTGTGNFSSQDVGMSVWNASGTAYGCNQLSSTHTGARFSMASSSPELFGTTIFDTHEIGLHLTASAVLGPQNGKGNLWEGSYADFGALHEGTFDLSLFFVEESPLSDFWPNPYYPPLWFQNGDKEAEHCLILACAEEEIPPPVTHEIDDSIALGGLSLTQYQEEVNWLAKQYLYAKLHENSHLMPEGSAMAAFYAAESAGTLGALYAIRESASGLFASDTITTAAFHAQQEHIGLNINKLVDIDSTLVTASSQDSVLLLADKVAVWTETDSLMGLQKQLLDGLAIDRIAAAPVLIANNAAIGAATLMEQNERDVNEVLLKTMVSGISTFDSTQLATLNQIANQCPISGGRGVFMARGLLAPFTDTIYYDDETVLCPPPQSRLSHAVETVEEEHRFKVYPNPAGYALNIESQLTYSNNLEINLVSLLGQNFALERYPRGNSSYSFNIAQIPRGVYLLTIRNGEEIIFKEKIVLLR